MGEGQPAIKMNRVRTDLPRLCSSRMIERVVVWFIMMNGRHWQPSDMYGLTSCRKVEGAVCTGGAENANPLKGG